MHRHSLHEVSQVSHVVDRKAVTRAKPAWQVFRHRRRKISQSLVGTGTASYFARTVEVPRHPVGWSLNRHGWFSSRGESLLTFRNLFFPALGHQQVNSVRAVECKNVQRIRHRSKMLNDCPETRKKCTNRSGNSGHLPHLSMSNFSALESSQPGRMWVFFKTSRYFTSTRSIGWTCLHATSSAGAHSSYASFSCYTQLY
jgi:hypothetical protein